MPQPEEYLNFHKNTNYPQIRLGCFASPESFSLVRSLTSGFALKASVSIRGAGRLGSPAEGPTEVAQQRAVAGLVGCRYRQARFSFPTPLESYFHLRPSSTSTLFKTHELR